MKKLFEAAAVIIGAAAVSALCVAASMGVFTRSTLSLTVDGTVTEFKLLPGEAAEVSALEAAGDGKRFICWLDSEGNEADPETPLFSDAAYTALIAPALAGGDMGPGSSAMKTASPCPEPSSPARKPRREPRLSLHRTSTRTARGARERHRLRLCPGP